MLPERLINPICGLDAEEPGPGPPTRWCWANRICEPDFLCIRSLGTDEEDVGGTCEGNGIGWPGSGVARQLSTPLPLVLRDAWRSEGVGACECFADEDNLDVCE